MRYVLSQDGLTVTTFPYSLVQMRQDNPQTSFPESPSDGILAGFGVYPVSMPARPAFDPRTHKVARAAAPALVDGAWVWGWDVIALTAEEAEAYRAGQVAAVKTEAGRRILSDYPDWKQRNMLMQGLRLLDKGRANLTAEEAAVVDALEAIGSQIDSIRTKSDEIEALDPIPLDITNDAHWT